MENNVKNPVNRIPKLANYYQPADPYNPASTDMFSPFSFKLDHKKAGGKLTHSGADVDLLLQEARVVFLYASGVSECTCKRTEDKENMKARPVCYSSNRKKLSSRGYLCETECPFANEKYKRPINQMILLLVQLPTTKEFVLARYYASLDRFKEFQQFQKTFRMKLPSNNPDAPYESANVARFTFSLKEFDKGNSGRLSNVFWDDKLTLEETQAVAQLIKDVTAMHAAKLAKDQERFTQIRADRLEKEKITGVTDPDPRHTEHSAAGTGDPDEGADEVSETAEAYPDAAAAAMAANEIMNNDDDEDLPH